MSSKSAFLCLTSAALLTSTEGSHSISNGELEVNANPIRKVVTMLQKMSEKLGNEAEHEKELYEKFECYCKKTQKSLQDAIDAAESVGPITPEDIEAKKNEVKALQNEVKKLKSDKIDDEASLQSAKVNRDKEHTVYVKVVGEEKQTEHAAESALESLGVSTTEKPSFLELNSDSQKSNSHSGFGIGAGTSWLPELIHGFMHSKRATIVAKRKVAAFLEGKGKENPADMEDVKTYITDIEHEAEDDIVVEDKEEDKEVVDYTGVKTSKKAEIAALLDMMEKKMKAMGTLEVDIVNMQHDMANGAESLADNKKMLAEVAKSCASKASDWKERQTYRADEQVALAETIKMLNSDDALELFKNTIKSPALLQISQNRQKVLDQAKAIVDNLRSNPKNAKHHSALNFLALKLAGNQVDLSSVFKKIDGMVVLMKTEQRDDDSKKQYCNKAFDESAERIKGVSRNLEQISASLETGKQSVEKLAGEMKALKAGISDLDSSIAEASENRKAEHASFNELISGNTAAVKLLGMAKDRLNHFYNPSLAPNTATTTANPYDLSLVQISEHNARAPTVEVGTPPPTFSGDYKARGEESNGILKMLDTLANDLEKEMTVSRTEESHSQKEYEETVAEAQRKRETDLKSIQGKAQSKADVESDLIEDKDAMSAKSTELHTAKKYVSDLHGECDWLLQNFDLRKQARVEETEGMTRAKAVLAGADFSL
eukprot:TRINITY_DN28530_c0_g1_i1.p1 TRINITY_DN28530_c0_g1~~TRINITY_DN28530_c0_g1_i1.p1  ORF type:complete len:715 (+),score=211.33 TRINITY_DN28530_c0_g1_i1:99-2243(+)